MSFGFQRVVEMSSCTVCGKAARDPVKELSIQVVYPKGGRKNIRINDFDNASFCQNHFVSFIALKVEEFRGAGAALV